MKKINLKIWDKVEIDWIDSVQSLRGWEDKQDFPWKDHYEAMIQKTMGYFTNMTKDAVSVCQSYSPDNDEHCIGMMSIPIGCIKNIKRFK